MLVRERAGAAGGGVRSEELTLPGFVHDVCSAIYPLTAMSPFFRSLPLAEHGLEWIHPPLPLAHPVPDAPAATLARDLAETADGLGEDGDAYRGLVGPVVEDWPRLERALLGPLLRAPRHPLALTRFGVRALQPASLLNRRTFSTERARALGAGLAAHSLLSLEHVGTAASQLVLGTAAHVVGWPFPRGGAQRLADALIAHLRALGGELEVGAPVESLDELPRTRTVLCDVTPRQFVRLAGDRLDARARRALERFRYGPAAFKLDLALDGPVPWRDAACSRAATVHVGASLTEIAASERAAWRGEHVERPFVLVAQPSLFDDTRAPAGKHTLWAYCHVPHASPVDMSEAIERQIERFAPGFRERILARHALGSAELERRNPNLVGGDIAGGAHTLRQLLARPTLGARPYRTPLRGVYLCSASAPPGAGVHGMCGYGAARAALRDGF